MTRQRGPRIVAALLLLLQTAGGGLVALAHAREGPTAPRTVEATHDARCAVVHNALHCAVCQLAGHRLPPARSAPPQWCAVVHRAPAPAAAVWAAVGLRVRAFPPRAPPLSNS